MINYLKSILNQKPTILSEEIRELGEQILFDYNIDTDDNTLKLNIGCGTDIREGFVNIDGSDTLKNIDKIMDISNESILNHYDKNSVDFILANDIIEHHYHWEAVKLLNDFFEVLKPGGRCQIRVPDCEYIINSKEYDSELKLVLLFGGQDVPRGIDEEMDKSRKLFPQYFCHKYGWSMERMRNDLEKIGFKQIAMKGEYSNFIIVAIK